MSVKFVTSGLEKNMFRPEKSFSTINRLWTHHSFLSIPVLCFSITQLLWRFMFSYHWGFRFWSSGLWYRSVRQVVTDFSLLACDTDRSDRLWLTFWSSGLWYRSVRQVVTDVSEKNTSGQQTSSSENLVTYSTTGCTVFSVSETYLRPRYAQLFLSLNRPVGTAYFSVRGLVNTKTHFEHRYQQNRRQNLGVLHSNEVLTYNN